ncbi:interferon-induced, double-stranded RNA-activated protein kinase isoform X2 [Sceloporus undulatus]|uniref:interferon-induced, double-stranded RNA-activated protein kinase isoform X2 n=1 Tax=Sceloporus undulatus TaxID=8520 RepID=UPI001C4BD514|nr:interferon-induced, double-stranded RNA-activated protein kinase isoform X2 [Sceloporus undulatus]
MKMADNHGGSCVYMAKLNEYCQKYRLRLEFPIVSVTGPPHDRIFTAAVEIDKTRYSEGKGKTKKEAKKHAAALAWEIIQQEKPAERASEIQRQPLPAPSPVPSLQAPLPAANIVEPSLNHISWLNEYAAKNNKVVEYHLESRDGPAHKPVFILFVKMDGEVLGEGTGNNKQTAKLNAAKLAYEKLIGRTTFTPERSATPTNSPANRVICSSKGASKVASVNGVHLDSECKSTADKLADQIGRIHLNESSSSSLATPKGSAMKPKRLAANFSMLHQKESRYTVNEGFLTEFENIEPLGTGGYGNVFKAKHKIDKKIYAVKRVKLTDGKEEKTKREVQALAKLVHENIVQYFGCWIGEDRFSSEDSMSDSSSGQAVPCNCLFIRMDYCEKGTLKNWIAQEEGKENYNEDVLMKFQQIVNGVEFIHEQKYVHRDLKPLNIFISRDNKIKIGDFGLVASGTDELLEQRTQNKGTRLYMAPEQEGSTYGKEVDIYSLGLILLEMLSAFKTEHERTEVIQSAKEGRLPETFIRQFPREAILIKKLLSKEPSERPTANGILSMLKKDPSYPHTY